MKRTVRQAMEDEVILFALVDTPDGLDSDQLARLIGADRTRVRRAVRRLRQDLSEDTYNIVAEPAGLHQPWVYKVVGNPDDAREWTARRMGELEARIATDRSFARSMVTATDGRTAQGRRARLIAESLRHLVETLELMDVD